jgi:hypothetical protein
VPIQNGRAVAEITAEVNILIAELKKLHVSVKYDIEQLRSLDLNSLNGNLKGCLSELVGPKI